MDVSIRPADKQMREAVIKARDDKQRAQEECEERKARKRAAATTKRLRRRIFKEVRADLLTEKRCFLRGEATGDEYVINTSIRYKKRNLRYARPFVESILKEALAQHSGFDYKVDFETDIEDGCNSIRIWYTLLNH